MKKFLREILQDKYRRKLQKIQIVLGFFYTKDRLRHLGYRAEIGDYSYGKPLVFHWEENTKLKIGKFCSISDEVKIFLGGNHRVDWISTFPRGMLLLVMMSGLAMELIFFQELL